MPAFPPHPSHQPAIPTHLAPDAVQLGHQWVVEQATGVVAQVVGGLDGAAVDSAAVLLPRHGGGMDDGGSAILRGGVAHVHHGPAEAGLGLGVVGLGVVGLNEC